MSVLTRESLEASPLADLHQLAAELKLDGYRRLRKADLIDAILVRQGGDEEPGADEEPIPAPGAEEEETPKRRPRSRRGGGRTRRRAEEDGSTDEDAGEDAAEDAEDATDAEPLLVADDEEAPKRRSRGRRAEADAEEEAPRRRSRARRDEDAEEEEPEEEPAGRRSRGRRGEAEEERVVEGVVELLANGSGFVRLSPPEPSDDDVYVSAAQVRRCELVNGDRVSGPVRRPRRSERYPSLVRIDTINGAPADEVAEGTPYDELPAAFPTERFAFGSEDPTLKAVEWLTPFGRGSRVVLAGGPGAGKTEALRLIAGALAGTEGLEVQVVLAGVRPEELGEWQAGPAEVVAAASFATAPETLGQLLERAVDTAKRVAARGGDAVLLVEGLDLVPRPVAVRVLGAARNIPDGGSLTVIAAASQPFGGETTVIALDPALALTRRLPALDLGRSATLRPELLVGDAGADAIADARAKALGV